jgi:hypothetical protein
MQSKSETSRYTDRTAERAATCFQPESVLGNQAYDLEKLPFLKRFQQKRQCFRALLSCAFKLMLLCRDEHSR